MSEKTDYHHSAGGLYSSTKDLSNLARAILKSTLLKPAQTRKWLKPHTHTASFQNSVGAPWEITRTSGLTQDNRVIDLYAKNGALGLYTSLLILIPDYDIALTILSAGPAAPNNVLAETAIKTFLPAIERIQKKHAVAHYAGSYTSSSSNSSLVLTVDEGPGLHITQWINHGRDIFAAYIALNQITRGTLNVRLYPTRLSSRTANSTATTISFRAIFRILAPPAPSNRSRPTSDRDRRFLSTTCQSWGAIDSFPYGLRGTDEFVFHVEGKGGEVVSVEPRAFRMVLEKRG